MDNIFDTITNKLPKTEGQAHTTEPKPISTKDLVSMWQKNKTDELTEELLNRFKPTIRSAINSYAPGTGDSLDIKAANITLGSLSKYDPSVGTDPTTFVFHNLKRLHRYNAQRSNIIPVPEQVALERKKLKEVADAFEVDNDREPTLEELANLSGFNTRKVDKLLHGNVVINDTSTLSEESKSSTFSMKDLTDDDYFEYVYTSVSPVDQKIMEWASGLHGKPVLSNNQIAAKLKISAAAVSQRKAKLQQMLSDVRGLL